MGLRRIRLHRIDSTASDSTASDSTASECTAPQRTAPDASHPMHRTRIQMPRPRGRLRLGNQPEPDSPAAPPRTRTEAPTRGCAVNLRRGSRAARMLGLEDQPGGDRPRISVPPGRARHARDLWRWRRAARKPRPAGPRIQAKGLVARLWRQRAAALRHLSRAGERRVGNPDLRSQPDSGFAADRGLRAHRHYRRNGEQPAGRDRTQGGAGNGAPAADQEQPAEGMGSPGRGRRCAARSADRR